LVVSILVSGGAKPMKRIYYLEAGYLVIEVPTLEGTSTTYYKKN
jgi:hypothetical protein